MNTKSNIKTSVWFLLNLILLFTIFYGFNLFFIGITSPGGRYSPLLDQHFNYIRAWRVFCLSTTTDILKANGYIVYSTETTLKVKDYGGFRIVYSCLGYGVMSFFAAFVCAFPKPIFSKIIFLVTGLIAIQSLNTLRFLLVSLYYQPENSFLTLNHHDLFNCALYIIIFAMIYLWLNFTKPQTNPVRN